MILLLLSIAFVWVMCWWAGKWGQSKLLAAALTLFVTPIIAAIVILVIGDKSKDKGLAYDYEKIRADYAIDDDDEDERQEPPKQLMADSPLMHPHRHKGVATSRSFYVDEELVAKNYKRHAAPKARSYL